LLLFEGSSQEEGVIMMDRRELPILLLILLTPVTALADTSILEQRLKLLEQTLQEQQWRIKAQDEKIRRQNVRVEQQQYQIKQQQLQLSDLTELVTRKGLVDNAMGTLDKPLFDNSDILPSKTMKESRAAGKQKVSIFPMKYKPEQSMQLAAAEVDGSRAPNSSAKGNSTGKTAAEQLRPNVRGAIPELTGILTQPGKLVLEPAFQFVHSSVNRITFRGVEVLNALSIGELSAEDVDRDTLIASLTGRFGITPRLEGEIKVPYVYRDDSLLAVVDSVGGDTSNPSVDRNMDDHGLGDVELALHYQINQGNDGGPFYIANLRYKSTTGEGPFDVARDDTGLEQELALGTGFHAVEPSLTILQPSDPAVLFFNLGYVYNMDDDVNETVGEVIVKNVDPGDAIRASFGMAYSINERFSFTMGYKHDYIDETETEFMNPETGIITVDAGTDLHVGALLLGFSMARENKAGINFNLELGITDDAPDVSMTIRTPFQWQMW
jgi:hypothetical protein